VIKRNAVVEFGASVIELELYEIQLVYIMLTSHCPTRQFCCIWQRLTVKNISPVAKLITALPRTLHDYEKNICCKDEGMNHNVPKLLKELLLGEVKVNVYGNDC